MDVTTKMLGDAGEHHAVCQFTLAGAPAVKMPDGWTAYDLAVDSGGGLVRVSVKTRSESMGWKNSAWFIFDERLPCDWIVFVFRPESGALRSWIMPFEVARYFGNVPTSERKDPHNRDVSWAKLNRDPLDRYENNWELRTWPEHDSLCNPPAPEDHANQDRTISNGDLQAYLLPAPGDHRAINEFAHTFDGYGHCGSVDECGRLADSVRQRFDVDGILPDSLGALRACLFYEHRARRQDMGEPSSREYAYTDALMEAIRARVPVAADFKFESQH